MYIKYLKNCKKFISGDHAVLRELLNGRKEKFAFRYSLAHATVKGGKKTKPHKLKTSEVYYILKGKGLMHIDNKTLKICSDCVINIPPNSVQYIENTGKEDLVFLCIVDPAWQAKDEIILNQKRMKSKNFL